MHEKFDFATHNFEDHCLIYTSSQLAKHFTVCIIVDHQYSSSVVFEIRCWSRRKKEEEDFYWYDEEGTVCEVEIKL